MNPASLMVVSFLWSTRMPELNYDRARLMQRDFLNLSEIAFLTGLSTTHIRDYLIKKGIIEAAKLGGVWVIPTDQLVVLRDHVRSETQKRREKSE